MKILINLIADLLKNYGIEATKNKVYAVIIGVLITSIISIFALIHLVDVNKEIAESKKIVEDTKNNIINLEDQIDNLTPPNKDKIINSVVKEIQDAQDNDASVF